MDMLLNNLQFLKDNFNIFLLIIGFFSLFIGSFLNVVICRLPRMLQNEWSQECRAYLGLKPHHPHETEPLNLCLPSSHCPACKNKLKPWHNIPILSYLVLQGKCAYCRARISLRYPIVEILCCIVSVYTAWRFGVSWQMVSGLFFTWILIALVFIDLEHQLLPDQLTLLLLWLGLLASLFNIFTDSQTAIIGAIAGYLIFAAIQALFKFATGKTGMGGGDYKLLAALGACLGWQQLPVIILFSSLIGLIFGITYIGIKHQFKSVPLPFGPYLAAAGWMSLLWGHEIVHLYSRYILL